MSDETYQVDRRQEGRGPFRSIANEHATPQSGRAVGYSAFTYSLNKRTGIILLSIALAFFIAIIVKYLVLGK